MASSMITNIEPLVLSLLTAQRTVKEDPFIKSLRSVNPRVSEMFPIWQDVDDVLDQQLFRRSTERTVNIEDDVEVNKKLPNSVDTITVTETRISHQRVTEFHHLPRGSIEPWAEYDLRIRMTPFFPETPNIIGTRMGALFAKKPTVDADAEVLPFLAHIGRRRQSYMDVLRFITQRSYSHGFLAVFVDFRPMPLDIRERIEAGRLISLTEIEERHVGEPVLGVFTEQQILDFEHDRTDGRLSWIKLRDTFIDRPTWMDGGETVEIFRIIDRFTTSVIEIRFRDGKWKVTAKDVFAHGAMNEDNMPEVPVVVIAPFKVNDDFVGTSAIYGSAVADLVATRILSSLLFALHFHGTPHLVLTSPDRKQTRMRSLSLGTTRFTQLFTDPVTGAEETLAYLQLDTQGLDMLVAQWEKFSKKANQLASRGIATNMDQPINQSGIAKAWDFKTGEEKSLTEHKTELEKASTEILQMLSRRLSDANIIGVDRIAASEMVSTSFDPSFILGDPESNLELADKIIAIAERENLAPLKIAGLRRVVDSVVNLSDTERQEIGEGIQEIEDEEPVEPPTPPPTPPPPPEGGPSEDGGDEGDE